ncbi:thiamine phosphate synthase [Aureibacillus halotolerans]|uniref:Thiamine-phosphate synthase n=1 Tax=Aureibacillus halotolerans TaxID=1508390 RepID=A0A4R6U5E0_9BACI|nr:thiamine phosphate synthase [Aureibacillus halotolerans]TDQ41688.1 thiamine-phosphate diphosphorylase [Aureibacillus halotolerans]
MKLGRVYAITGEQFHPQRPLEEVMRDVLEGGASIVQLRDKKNAPHLVREKAFQLKALCDLYQVPLIINDYIDIAIEVDAAGVHLGQEDVAIEKARAELGPSKLIGISTHGIEQAMDAQRRGADYIGAGPIYDTQTKEDVVAPVGLGYIKELVSAELRIPFVAIGGIKLHNLHEVIEAGASTVCMVSEIVGNERPAHQIQQAIQAFSYEEKR